MGKTPKKGAPEGDERSNYVRRLKTTSASSKPEISANLTATRSNQPHTENINRGKQPTIQKHLKAAPSSNTFKSKLRSPSMKTSSRGLKAVSKIASSDKEAPKSNIPLKVSKNKMQPTGENSEDTNVDEPLLKESSKDDNTNDDIICIEINGEKVDSDVITVESEELNGNKVNADQEDVSTDKFEDAIQLKDGESDDKSVSKEEIEECDVKLTLTPEDSPNKSSPSEELPVIVEETVTDEQTPRKETEESREDTEDETSPPVGNEKCRVESTTSETTEDTETVEPEVEKVDDAIKRTEENGQDDSFVSFDASLMLKDVQIRLNDCLKDNSHLFDVTNHELNRDTSFGKTLRNISGRHSINHMRHVTIRNRHTPNSSMYVNLSSASVAEDESKVQRPAAVSDTCTSSNGTPSERKRKLESETSNEAKKMKTDSDTGVLDTSIGLLQNLRRPVQVSTPNVKEYKFNFDKLPASGEEKVNPEEVGGARKWCSIM